MESRIAALALTTVVLGCGTTVVLLRHHEHERVKPETVNDLFPHSSIDVALVPVVLELATCDAARELLLRVAAQQHTRHSRPLRVRCQPPRASGSGYSSDGVWLPSSSTVRVACHNAPPVQVGSLLFELLNADEEEGQYAAIRQQRDAGALGGRDQGGCHDGECAGGGGDAHHRTRARVCAVRAARRPARGASGEGSAGLRVAA